MGMRPHKLMMAICGLALAAGMAACSRTRANSPDVRDRIRRSLDQSGLNSVKVSQDRNKGVVTLSGDVPADADKATAENIAKSIASDAVVADQIAVVPPADSSAAKKVNADIDEGIEKNIDAALTRNKLKKDVSYDVKNGVVTLTGTVNSLRQKSEAERIAKSVPHVAQVVNEIQVKNQRAASSS